jgi:putative ABC transport system permease protein
VTTPPDRPPTPPPAPAWVRWTLRRLLDEGELGVVLDELADLHAAVADRHGRREADRRYRRQLRQYPVRLLVGRVRAALSASSPGGGEVSRAARSLLAAPALTATIVLTVGIGIGGCTTIFALVDALYLRPLPYPDAHRLAWIFTDAPPNRFPFSVVDFQALETQQAAFAHVAATASVGRALTTPDGVELVRVLEATPGLLETWGLSVLRGRAPTDAEGSPGSSGTAMVTSGFADRHLRGGAAAALGQAITLDGEPYQIIGILPPTLGPLARGADVVPTLRLEPPSRKGPFFLQVFGRLRPGVEPRAAAEELRAMNRQLFPLWADSYQDRNASWGLMDVTRRARGDAGPLLGVLMAAVGMVLLIALSNASNLLLARLGGRARELAVRAALGASGARIRAHLLVESAWLAAGGAVLGVGLARAGVAALPSVASAWLGRAGEAELTPHTVAFALLLAAAGAAVFAAVPALRGDGRDDLAAALRAGGRSSTESLSKQRSRRFLVAGQMAIVTPLLAGAMLLLGTFVRLQRMDPGFDADHVLTMGVMLSPAPYPDAVSRERFWEPALARIGSLPGVVRAALATERPPAEVNNVNNFDLEDRPTRPGQPERVAAWVVAGPSYFETMGIPLVEGRGFRRADLDDDAPPVVLVDEAWTRANYPGESPVGRRLYSGGQTTGPRTTIVGVVGTVPYNGLGTSELGAVYEPTANRLSDAWLVVRTTGDPLDVASHVRAELRRLDPAVPVVRMATGRELLHDALARPRHLSLLLSVFSAVALGLAVVGVYGITAYSVQRRRGDIAVRLALGGAPGEVLGRTLWEGMRVSLAGLAAGLVAALLLTGALSGLLYGVAPRDPASLGLAAALLLCVSATACLIPAVRAVRVDPASTLREE